MTSVRIGRSSIGPGHPVYMIGEIGLNHNGDVDVAKRLIDVAVEALGTDGLILMHATSSYPMPAEEANLRMIDTLHRRYPGVPIGYSGHERGLQISLAAVTLGAVAVADAVPSVRAIARLVLDRRGGTGAVRELAELIVGARTIPESAYADRVVHKQGAFA